MLVLVQQVLVQQQIQQKISNIWIKCRKFELNSRKSVEGFVCLFSLIDRSSIDKTWIPFRRPRGSQASTPLPLASPAGGTSRFITLTQTAQADGQVIRIVRTQEAVAHRKNSREREQMLSALTGKALESEGDAGLPCG